MLRPASLISALPLASPPHQTKATETLALLAYALTNIARETEFFDSLPPRFLVDLEADPSPEERDVRFKTNLGNLQGKMMRPITRAFVDLLISTGAEAGRIDGGMEEGIVLLWAMEKVGASLLAFRVQDRADIGKGSSGSCTTPPGATPRPCPRIRLRPGTRPTRERRPRSTS